MRWRQNPERVAWIILLGNFMACCVLAVVVPLAVRSYALHATRSLPTVVTTTAGTVQVQVPGAAEPNAVPERREVPEGSQIVTDRLAQALVTVADSANNEPPVATVRILQNTALKIQQARTPRFPWSSDANVIELLLERGRVRVASVSEDARPLQITLQTPHVNTTFHGSTFDIAVRAEDTQVTALEGSAQVIAAGSQVTVSSGQRVVIPAGRAPGLPVPAEQNLIRNGGFQEELEPAWQKVVQVAPNHESGQILREMSGDPAVRFVRRTEDQAPNSAGVKQVLQQDVQSHDSLVLQFDLLCLHQSVPGGGQMDSEYPIKVDIEYTDVYGKSNLHWFQGFYCDDLPPGSPWPPPAGQKVTRGVWYTYESPNLIELLKDTRPAQINSITISANGHDYESLITNVALVVR